MQTWGVPCLYGTGKFTAETRETVRVAGVKQLGHVVRLLGAPLDTGDGRPANKMEVAATLRTLKFEKISARRRKMTKVFTYTHAFSCTHPDMCIYMYI
jgi:hypothetical protein